jgi:hypothetical protein
MNYDVIRGLAGAGKWTPPVDDSREEGARRTESTRALSVGAPRGSHMVATADGRAEVAPTWRHEGTHSGRH